MELEWAPALAWEPPKRPADWAAAAAWALHEEKEGGKKMGMAAGGGGEGSRGVSSRCLVAEGWLDE